MNFLIGIIVKKTIRIWLTRELIAEMEVRHGKRSMSGFTEGIFRLDPEYPQAG